MSSSFASARGGKAEKGNAASSFPAGSGRFVTAAWVSAETNVVIVGIVWLTIQRLRDRLGGDR